MVISTWNLDCDDPLFRNGASAFVARVSSRMERLYRTWWAQRRFFLNSFDGRVPAERPVNISLLAGSAHSSARQPLRILSARAVLRRWMHVTIFGRKRSQVMHYMHSMRISTIMLCDGYVKDYSDSKGRACYGGGETGIRTLDTLSSIHAFQACAFSHSAISPRLQIVFLNLSHVQGYGRRRRRMAMNLWLRGSTALGEIVYFSLFAHV